MLRRNELVLVTFSLRARSVSVVTNKKKREEESKHVGKCTGGEVGGFKHLWEYT